MTVVSRHSIATDLTGFALEAMTRASHNSSRDGSAISSMFDPTGAPITAFGASVGVGRLGRQVGCRRRPDRLSRGYRRYGAGCHATPARVRPTTPGDGSGPGPDPVFETTGLRQRLDALSSVVAAQWAAELDRPQPPADPRSDAPPRPCHIPGAASLCPGRMEL